MAPQLPRIKDGQTVHVRATYRVSDGRSYIVVADETLSIARVEIMHVEPVPLEAGEEVFCKRFARLVRILGLDGKWAWVVFTSGPDMHSGGVVVPLDTLERTFRESDDGSDE